MTWPATSLECAELRNVPARALAGSLLAIASKGSVAMNVNLAPASDLEKASDVRQPLFRYERKGALLPSGDGWWRLRFGRDVFAVQLSGNASARAAAQLP
jgi:hypothetical protein